MKETGSQVRREEAKLALVLSSPLSKAVCVLHRAAWSLCSLEAPSCFLKLYGASEESDLGIGNGLWKAMPSEWRLRRGLRIHPFPLTFTVSH